MRKILLIIALVYSQLAGAQLQVTIDTSSVFLSPSATDSWPELQGAINAHKVIHLSPGIFFISQPLVVVNRVGDNYGQSWVSIHGATKAKNTSEDYVTKITPLFTDRPALAIQEGKGCQVENIYFKGLYTLPNSLDILQIDTLLRSQWDVPGISSGPTNPYTAIAIDPFSDPKMYDSTHQQYAGMSSYYLSGMDRGGSTDIDIRGCCITDFVVGVIITPSNQQNGELINIDDCHIDYCKDAIAWTQAQSKANTVTRLMCWGGVHTVFNGSDYGFPHGDGATAPFIDVVNIAGGVHQLISRITYAFPISIKRVYAERLFKIGFTGGPAAVSFTDCQFDFQNSSPGVPSPDYYCLGRSITWINCMLRLYGSTQPMIFTSNNNAFVGGSISEIPMTWPVDIVGGGVSSNQALFLNTAIFYVDTILNGKLDQSDMHGTWGNVTVNRQDYSGYFVAEGPVPKAGILLTYYGAYYDQPTISGWQTLGFVQRVSADTAYLQNVGVGVKGGTYSVFEYQPGK